MFYLASINQNPAIITDIEEAVGMLMRSGAIAALMEIQGERGKPQPTTHPLETNSARAAWLDGYSECLRDLCHFRTRYGVKEKEQIKPATFGAGERSLATGDLTPEEYEAMYGRKPPAELIPKQLLPKSPPGSGGAKSG